MRRLLPLLLLIAMLMPSPSVCQADPLDQWHLRNPFPTPCSLRDVAHGNGTWVAAGSVGSILTSPNGIRWSAKDSGTHNTFNGIAFGNGSFVAVGTNGAIIRSTDGSTWSPCVSGTSAALRGVRFGSGYFVAVGDDGTLLASPNAIDWTAVPSGTTGTIQGIAYGNDKFVAYFYVEAGGSQGKVLTSTDALNWDLLDVQFSLVAPCYSGYSVIDFAGGKFFLSNGVFIFGGGGGCGGPCCQPPVLTSSDGIAWDMLPPYVPGRFSVAYGENLFVSNQGLSGDGLEFSEVSDFGEASIYRIVHAAGKFVAVGSEIFESLDGLNWTRRTVGITDTLNGVVYAKNRFIAVGSSGTILASRNGRAWEERLSGSINVLTGIAHGARTFVAVGNGGTILTSPDGYIWTPQVSGTNEDLSAITRGKGKFVAVGTNRTILTSPDGITWTIAFSLQGVNLSKVAFGNRRFVASGDGGVVLTSPDGDTWTANTILPSGSMKVFFGNGKFLITESVGATRTLRVLSSTTGANWTQTAEFDGFGSLAGFANGVFFLVHVAPDNRRSFQTSTDGMIWTPRDIPVPPYAISVAFGAGTYVAVGSYGSILQSDPVTPEP